MSEFTLSTEDVRIACEKALRAIYPRASRREAFDRWLKQVKAEALLEAARDLEANGTALFADQIPASEHWVAQRLGSYGEPAWLRDRAKSMSRDADIHALLHSRDTPCRPRKNVRH